MSSPVRQGQAAFLAEEAAYERNLLLALRAQPVEIVSRKVGAARSARYRKEELEDLQKHNDREERLGDRE